MKEHIRSFAIVAAIASPLVAQADTVFSDGTFNLQDYTVMTSTTDSSQGTVTISQNPSSGNPGPDLDANYNLSVAPFSSVSVNATMLNNTFLYDPTTQGAIGHITASYDFTQSETVNGVTQPAAASSTYGFLLEQGGLYYIAVNTSPNGTGAFTHESVDLTASMFDLVSDPSQHPNFSAGPIKLGISTGVNDSITNTAITVDRQYDNLSFDVAPPVPLPASGWLMLSGIFGFGVMVRMRKVQPIDTLNCG